MRTVAEPVEGEYVRVEPSDEPGIRVNGIPATLDRVRKADVRVDLVASDRAAPADRAFVVEHVLGPLRLCGVTAANVVGTAAEWDFSRPEHRICYSRAGGPDAVVGHPAGLPNPALADAVAAAGTVADGRDRRRTTVAEPVSVETDDGSITVAPRPAGSGVALDLRYDGARFTADVPADGASRDVVEAVTTATTPYLAPEPEIAVTHAAADVLSDVVAIGGLDDVRIDADLGGAYHAMTVGVAERARDRGLVVERGG